MLKPNAKNTNTEYKIQDYRKYKVLARLKKL